MHHQLCNTPKRIADRGRDFQRLITTRQASIFTGAGPSMVREHSTVATRAGLCRNKVVMIFLIDAN